MLNKIIFLKDIDKYIWKIKEWKIFIYPTDTVFWIWANIYNKESIETIFSLKQRESKPLSIIVPDIKWIEKNCIINKEKINKIKKLLPWPYSFVLNLKQKEDISSRIRNGWESISVRIPDSWFSKVVQKAWVPFITTSVNISGEPSAVKISEIPESIISWVDYVIDWEEELSWKWSTIIDLRWDEEIILRK
jgi:tRNA threonylcarbamoyl adenosine modification protein (Sua5/YciO/YrdC/YwlC family)